MFDDFDLLEEQPSEVAKKGYWRTRDGRLLKIKKIPNEHLVNILKFLYRKVVDTLVETLTEIEMHNDVITMLGSNQDTIYLQISKDSKGKEILNEVKRRLGKNWKLLV